MKNFLNRKVEKLDAKLLKLVVFTARYEEDRLIWKLLVQLK